MLDNREYGNRSGFRGSGFNEILNPPTSKVNERKATLNGEP